RVALRHRVAEHLLDLLQLRLDLPGERFVNTRQRQKPARDSTAHLKLHLSAGRAILHEAKYRALPKRTQTDSEVIRHRLNGQSGCRFSPAHRTKRPSATVPSAPAAPVVSDGCGTRWSSTGPGTTPRSRVAATPTPTTVPVRAPGLSTRGALSAGSAKNISTMMRT